MSNMSSQNDAEKKAQVRAYFSRTAQGYVTSNVHRTGDDLKRLIEIGEWESQQHALDVATGGGHTALAVAPHVGQVTVSDLTPVMLETARAFLLSQGVTNATFQVADAENLPFADASFERVTCRIAPHHFPDIKRAVREIARVLKPGGLFLLIDNIVPSDAELDAFDNTFEKWHDASHGRAYTQEEWQAFFAQAGLQIELQEISSKQLNYHDWTARAQMSDVDKAALESYMLNSSEKIKTYFALTTQADGQLESFRIDYILLKGRKL